MFLVPLALAHDPHDIAPFVSVAADGTVMTALKDLLAVTLDGQGFYYPYPGGPWLECGWALSVSTLVAIGEGSIYASKDGGQSFVLTGPSGVTGCNRGDDAMLVAAQGGIWSSGDGLLWNKVAEVGWDAVQIVPYSGAFFLRDSAGRIYSTRDLSQPVAQGRYNTLATDGQRLVLAAADGFLVISEDGQNFQPLATGPVDVQALTLEGNTLAAATATEAVHISEDGGDSWHLVSDNLEALASQTDLHYFDLALHAGTLYLAAWEGLFRLPPGADHWHQTSLRSVPEIWDTAWLSDGSLLLGNYGGGVYQGTAGTPDWRDASGNITSPYTHRLWVEGKDWYILSGLDVWQKKSERYTSLMVPGEEVGEGLARLGDQSLLVGGGEGAIQRWDGSQWKTFGVDNCSRRPSEILARDQEVWAGCDNHLYHSENGGITWITVAEFSSQVNCLWWDASDTLLIGTDDGAYATGNGEDIQPYAWMGIKILEMARAPDGVLWAATSLGIGKKEEEETLIGWPIMDRPLTLAIRYDGAIVAGLQDGAWWSTDQGVTWNRACSWDILDDAEGSWWWDGWEVSSLEGAKGGKLRTGGEGAIAEIEVEADHFTLLAANGEPVLISITVDGSKEQLSLPPGALGPRWTFQASPGLHTLRFEVLQGTLSIDALERWRDPDNGSESPQDGSKDRACGCNQGSAWLILPFLGILRRRRTVR